MRARWRGWIRQWTVLYEMGNTLHASRMAIVNIRAARDNLSDAVEKARTDAVFLER